MKALIALIFLLFASNWVFGQELEKMHLFQDTLVSISMIVSDDTLKQKEIRYLANKDFIQTLVRALKTPHSFDYPFKQLRTVSIQYSPDSLFRLFTWQLKVDTGAYHYYGAIQWNTDTLTLIPLIDRYSKVVNPEQQKLSPDQWFGGIVYNIEKVSQKKQPYYMLYTYRVKDTYTRQKYIDVMTINPKTKAINFGAPVFLHKDLEGKQLTKNRVLIEYSFDASAFLRFDEYYNKIIYDNLISIPPMYPGQKEALVPDGSYCGYELTKEGWIYIDKIFNDFQEEAPTPKPVLKESNVEKP